MTAGRHERRCCYCGNAEDRSGSGERELRPYGPGGALTCFVCATSSPERTATAKQQTRLALDAALAASPRGVAVITDYGIVPLPEADA